jgi:uncharacterized protein (DUF885 family)
MTEPTRAPSAVDAIAEEWVDTLVELDPLVGTYIGRTEANSRFGDFSPAGHDRYVAEVKRTLAALDAAKPVDSIDEVTKTDLTSELRLDLESADAQLHLRDLNVIASPAQGIREIFDIMPTTTVEDWDDVSARLKALPDAIAGYIETLRLGIERGITPAKRQVHEVFEQAKKYSADEGFFVGLAATAAPAEGQLPASLASDLSANAGQAAVAYRSLADFLAHELEPVAQEQDAVGREIYALQSRRFLGATIDLDETYEWGIDELARMVAEQESIAREIKPGASVE